MYRIPWGARLRVLSCSVLLGCGGGDDGTPVAPSTRPPSVVRQVLPSATDPGIDVANDPHIATNPSPTIAPVGRLFVFLPGTGGVPANQQLIQSTAAARGYHAIGLTYPNPTAVGVLCADDIDPECFWDVRREVITGLNTSARIQVTPANAIVNRLEKLLTYLQAQYPAEGWGQYLLAGRIDWSRVTLAGHSQGGGHVGVLTKLVALDRAVYFSSPADWRQVANTPATWLSRPNITAASRQFAFIHEQDQLVPELQARANWVALGLDAFGPVTNVDGMNPPYGNSHRLTTRAIPLLAGSYHGATVVDAGTPRTGGTPTFQPVWIYLAFPD
ncbi:MAG: BPSS1187 family protein [Gemmatimonadota bacterium]